MGSEGEVVFRGVKYNTSFCEGCIFMLKTEYSKGDASDYVGTDILENKIKT